MTKQRSESALFLGAVLLLVVTIAGTLLLMDNFVELKSYSSVGSSQATASFEVGVVPPEPRYAGGSVTLNIIKDSVYGGE